MPRQMQWGIAAICERFGVPSFHAWRDAMAAYRLGGLASAIRCPVLALVGDREGIEPLAQFDAGGRGGGPGDRGALHRRGRCLDPLPVGQHPALGPGHLRLAGPAGRAVADRSGSAAPSGSREAEPRAQAGHWPQPLRACSSAAAGPGWPGGLVGQAGEAQPVPGGRRELVGPVVPVAGVDGVVATRLALAELGPDPAGGTGHRWRWPGPGRRRRGRGRRGGRHGTGGRTGTVPAPGRPAWERVVGPGQVERGGGEARRGHAPAGDTDR